MDSPGPIAGLGLDDLPLPYLFDVQALDRITATALRDHIARQGVTLYAAPGVDRARNP